MYHVLPAVFPSVFSPFTWLQKFVLVVLPPGPVTSSLPARLTCWENLPSRLVTTGCHVAPTFLAPMVGTIDSSNVRPKSAPRGWEGGAPPATLVVAFSRSDTSGPDRTGPGRTCSTESATGALARRFCRAPASAGSAVAVAPSG